MVRVLGGVKKEINYTKNGGQHKGGAREVKKKKVMLYTEWARQNKWKWERN